MTRLDCNDSRPGAGAAATRAARAQGFTLVELLIALAIMAIVAAVALPLYNQYSDRTFRSEAQADLMNCAQALERFSSINFSYEGSADTDADGIGDADAGPIAGNICDPISARAANDRYAFTVNATATTFTLTATPENQMAGDGVMTIDDRGNRQWDANNDGDFDDDGEDGWTE